MKITNLVIHLDQLAGALEPASWTWDPRTVGNDSIEEGAYDCATAGAPTITEQSRDENVVTVLVDTRSAQLGTYLFKYSASGTPSGAIYRANIEVTVR